MRRVRSLASPLLLALAAAATPLLVPADASAGWPPAPDATPEDSPIRPTGRTIPATAYSATRRRAVEPYSFMPGVAHPRTAETASGMSVDMAWRLTIGDPSVHIVVTDSGIKWDEDDLIEKACLNDKELANHKPQHADGTACGGDGRARGLRLQRRRHAHGRRLQGHARRSRPRPRWGTRRATRTATASSTRAT